VYRPLAGESFWVGTSILAYQFTVDAFGLLFVVGVGMAMVRRYRDRDGRLGNTPRSKTTRSSGPSSHSASAASSSQALGIVGQPARADETVSFIGMAMAAGFRWVGLTPGGAEAIYGVIWWSHSLLAFAFIAWIPYAKPFHMISSFANVVARDDENAGARLPNVPADLDHTNAESLDDFTWKELMDGDACTKCGRCTDAARPTRSAGTSTRGT